jgi:kynurenine formamidase
VPGPWIDLTRPMHPAMAIYAAGGYTDPPFRAARWCAIAEQGFEVWRLEMGTQTGTHIDAPAHFAAGGATLDGLAPDDLVGRYFHVDAAALASGAPGRTLAGYAGEAILFVDATAEVAVPEAALAALLALPCRVWVMAGALRVASREPLHLHRALAAAGNYLVEDLDPAAVPRVPARGEVIALPLRLEGVSGAPARVVVRAID